MCSKLTQYVQPALISKHVFPIGQQCIISGWGDSSTADGIQERSHLRSGKVRISPSRGRKSCSRQRFFNEAQHICAQGRSYPGRKDEGGPLICFDSNKKAILVGIIST